MRLDEYNCGRPAKVLWTWAILHSAMAQSAKVWNAGRKWLGNLLPLAVMTPGLVKAILAYRDRAWDADLWMIWLGGTLGAGWLALNLFGFIGNARMRRAIALQLQAQGISIPTDATFVGIATPAFRNALDPHEDLGFFCLHSDRFDFLGETKRITIQRTDVHRLRFRPNLHTMVGIGGWARLEGIQNGEVWHLYVEPRIHTILLTNFFASFGFRRRLRRWISRQQP